jgi:hypothetical protein
MQSEPGELEAKQDKFAEENHYDLDIKKNLAHSDLFTWRAEIDETREKLRQDIKSESERMQ